MSTISLIESRAYTTNTRASQFFNVIGRYCKVSSLFSKADKDPLKDYKTMSGFMEVSFPFSQTQGMFNDAQQLHHPAANGSNAHWSFLPSQSNGAFYQSQQQAVVNSNQQCGNRKRSFDQALRPTNEQAKKARSEMPFPSAQPMCSVESAGPVNYFPVDYSGSFVCQQATFPTSYLEHQAVTLAEKKYHSSLLEALLYEAHGC